MVDCGTRLSACGNAVPVIAVLVSAYVVVGPAFVPIKMYFPVEVPEGIDVRYTSAPTGTFVTVTGVFPGTAIVS
jgi:hypothetical protein